jgi:hypothetical protein
MTANEPESPSKNASGKEPRPILTLILNVLGSLIVGVVLLAAQVIAENIRSEAAQNPCDTHKGLDRIEALTVTADSTRSPQPPLDYEADNLNDNDPATIWIEGDKDGYGRGHQVRFTLPENTDLRLICIVNGFARSEAQYAKNSRVEQLRVETDRGTQRTVLPDKPNEDFAARQPLAFVKGKTSQVALTLEEARAASGADPARDTSISDVLFWARP